MGNDRTYFYCLFKMTFQKHARAMIRTRHPDASHSLARLSDGRRQDCSKSSHSETGTLRGPKHHSLLVHFRSFREVWRLRRRRHAVREALRMAVQRPSWTSTHAVQGVASSARFIYDTRRIADTNDGKRRQYDDYSPSAPSVASTRRTSSREKGGWQPPQLATISAATSN